MTKTTTKETTHKTGNQFDYSASIAKLEEIVGQLESGNVPIDQALELHTEGQKLADDIAAYLEQVGLDIRVQANKE